MQLHSDEDEAFSDMLKIGELLYLQWKEELQQFPLKPYRSLRAQALIWHSTTSSEAEKESLYHVHLKKIDVHSIAYQVNICKLILIVMLHFFRILSNLPVIPSIKNQHGINSFCYYMN